MPESSAGAELGAVRDGVDMPPRTRCCASARVPRQPGDQPRVVLTRVSASGPWNAGREPRQTIAACFRCAWPILHLIRERAPRWAIVQVIGAQRWIAQRVMLGSRGVAPAVSRVAKFPQRQAPGAKVIPRTDAGRLDLAADAAEVNMLRRSGEIAEEDAVDAVGPQSAARRSR